MAQEGFRAQVAAYWRTFNALVDVQSGGNEELVRAVDLFEGARGAFTAEQGAANNPAAADAAAAAFQVPNIFVGQHTQHGLGGQSGPPISFPRGTANVGTDVDPAHQAYFAAEEAIRLAHSQFNRNEQTVQRMEEVVERVMACIGARYSTADEVGSPQERGDAWVRASEEALDRGHSGCAMSAVEIARTMALLLQRHKSELDLQEQVTWSLHYETPAETITAYRETLRRRPFMSDIESEVQENRELNQELGGPRMR